MDRQRKRRRRRRLRYKCMLPQYHPRLVGFPGRSSELAELRVPPRRQYSEMNHPRTLHSPRLGPVDALHELGRTSEPIIHVGPTSVSAHSRQQPTVPTP
ncbi:hypothetical protein SO802_029115 [Lithocarpus litseifolius]|uniref:Uncharacterized protein n=1 Tax=Lithocarpus litseifolius TaxID=425828 RepID=A0AAW2BSA9_9ROSI